MMDIINYSDEYFMKEAMKEAEKAMVRDEIPVGAVIVYNNQIIGRAHNLTETLNDVTAHAEMQAFTAAANTLGGKYLSECTLYVTCVQVHPTGHKLAKLYMVLLMRNGDSQGSKRRFFTRKPRSCQVYLKRNAAGS